MIRRRHGRGSGLLLRVVAAISCLTLVSTGGGYSGVCDLRWPLSAGSTWAGGQLTVKNEGGQCAAPRCCFPTGATLRSIRDTPTLLATLEALKKGRSDVPAMVILYYGDWCPFSAALLPLVRCLPHFFSAQHVQFVSVLESDVGLRTLIQLGVDSFPTLKVVQASGSTSVPGPRVLRSLIVAIAKITSVAPCDGPFHTLPANSSATCLPVPLRPPPGVCLVGRNGCATGASHLVDQRVVKSCSEAYLSTTEPLPVYGGTDMLAWVALLFILLRFGILLCRRYRDRQLEEPPGAEQQPLQAAPGPDAPAPFLLLQRGILAHQISSDEDDDESWDSELGSSMDDESDDSYDDTDTESMSEDTSPSSSGQHNAVNRYD